MEPMRQMDTIQERALKLGQPANTFLPHLTKRRFQELGGVLKYSTPAPDSLCMKFASLHRKGAPSGGPLTYEDLRIAELTRYKTTECVDIGVDENAAEALFLDDNADTYSQTS